MWKDPNVVPNNIVNPSDHCNVCVEPQPLLRRISAHYRDRPVEPVLPRLSSYILCAFGVCYSCVHGFQSSAVIRTRVTAQHTTITY